MSKVKAADGESKKLSMELKQGNYKSAKNCVQISTVANQRGFLPSTSATNQIVVGQGLIEKFQENGSTGEGFIKEQRGGRYAVIKSNKDTLWFDKGNIKIGADALVVGKYVQNTNLPLVSGASQQALVLELICIQSGASTLESLF